MNHSSPLHEAASQGNVESIKCLLEAGADINAKDGWKHSSPLHEAASQGNVESIKCLLEAGAEINAKDGWNHSSPLHQAVSQGNVESIKCLLEAGADIDIKDRSQSSPLYKAASQGNVESIKCLLEAGADINAKDGWNKSSPLYEATSQGNIESIKCLLEAGADVNAKDRWYESSSLHKATSQGNIESIKCLLEAGANVNAKDWCQSSPLHQAASQGNINSVKSVKCLLEAGANINAKDEDQSSPLHKAASQGNIKSVKCLLKAGANINAKDKDQSSPLHEAASQGNIESIKCLLKAGANINAKDKDQSAPLHKAASKGNVQSVKCLLEAGAKINVKDKDQSSPLHEAASKGNIKSVKCLLEAGADAMATDCYGFTPCQMVEEARWSGHYVETMYALKKAMSYALLNIQGSSLPQFSKSRQQEHDINFGSTGDLKMELPMVISGVTVKSCADSGSEENIIDASLADRLGLRIRREKKDCKIFEIGNGKIVRSIGRTRANCTFAKDARNRIKCWFYVFAQLATPLIMGMGFLDHTQTMTKRQDRLQQCTLLPSEFFSVRSIGRPRRQLACLVNGQYVLAKADSGSEIDMMSLSYAKTLGYRVDRTQESRSRVMFADRTVGETIGQITANIVLGDAGGQSYLRTFHVFPGLSSDVLLGENILQQTQAFSTLQSSFVDNLMEAGPLELKRLIWMGRVEKLLAKLRSSRKSRGPSLSLVERQNKRDARENYRRELERKRITTLTGEELARAEEAERRRIERYDHDRERELLVL
ncbi:hypothetical protein GJ744_000252 [Endocarpon pusillum]|uniref:Uncharacterized protein n=1 Tax=Endocarpon pusillum TaxID=364733 RepID=A0A8H7ANV4_9EURO|nr:hypothetical protein GJ744_000252 [Endocarpon pusillum]